MVCLTTFTSIFSGTSVWFDKERVISFVPFWQFYFHALRNTEQTKDKSPHLNTE